VANEHSDEPADDWTSIQTETRYVLRLYVTGATSRSARAISNTRRICETHLPGRFDLEIIDIYESPFSATEHQIVAAPTLVRLLPTPIRRIIGDLSDELKTLRALGLGHQTGEARR
jgi:circadian clock protein KaiB